MIAAYNIIRKVTVTLLFTLITLTFSFAQNVKGTVLHERFLASSIQGNPAGEDAVRRLTIYLPPHYYQSKQQYPAIYFCMVCTETIALPWPTWK